MEFLKHYKWDLGITAVVTVLVGHFMGWGNVPSLLILLVLEVSLSFDNAIVNATVLNRMSHFWRIMFLTLGMAIAVLGMRFVFPILIVVMTTDLGFGEVINVAVNNPTLYAEKLGEAHHLIAMFGGVYLLLIALNFLFEKRDLAWIWVIEAPFAKVGQLNMLSYILTGGLILWATNQYGGDESLSLLIAGMSSLVLHMAVQSFSDLFETEDEEDVEKSANSTVALRTGFAGLASFVYLEVQDSAFSFDGVTGAFAITDSVIIIMLGLGLGALYVRSMTIHFVETGQIGKYRYLEHGAYYAITSLAICLLLGVADIEVPEYITGFLGAFFVGSAWAHSAWKNRTDPEFEDASPEEVLTQDVIAR